jgi:hypothetical protein
MKRLAYRVPEAHVALVFVLPRATARTCTHLYVVHTSMEYPLLRWFGRSWLFTRGISLSLHRNCLSRRSWFRSNVISSLSSSFLLVMLVYRVWVVWDRDKRLRVALFVFSLLSVGAATGLTLSLINSFVGRYSSITFTVPCMFTSSFSGSPSTTACLYYCFRHRLITDSLLIFYFWIFHW